MADTDQHPRANVGIPRWLVIAFAAKLVLVVAIVGAVLWWAGR